MSPPSKWDLLQERIVRCRRCPRLREHCARTAREKRAAYRDETYWGKPVGDFGAPGAGLLVVGLAPGAHGANRTGRMFTGDRSGEFLYRALHETGFTNRPESTARGDGLRLRRCAVTAVVRCAPPANRPTAEEIAACRPFFEKTVSLLRRLAVVVALGGVAFEGCVRLYRDRGWLPSGPKPRFAHGAAYEFPGAPALLASYHPSQQNTFTGRLTGEMLRAVFEEAARRIDGPGRGR